MVLTGGAAPQAMAERPVLTERQALERRRAALRARHVRNRLFGVLLATVSLTMFVIVVGLVIGFHVLEAYRVIPGF